MNCAGRAHLRRAQRQAAALCAGGARRRGKVAHVPLHAGPPPAFWARRAHAGAVDGVCRCAGARTTAARPGRPDSRRHRGQAGGAARCCGRPGHRPRRTERPRHVVHPASRCATPSSPPWSWWRFVVMGHLFVPASAGRPVPQHRFPGGRGHHRAYPGASPEIVESEVTKNVEEDGERGGGCEHPHLAQLRRLSRSSSSNSSCTIDGRKAAEDVREKIGDPAADCCATEVEGAACAALRPGGPIHLVGRRAFQRP